MKQHCKICGFELPLPWTPEHSVKCRNCGAVKLPPHLDITERAEDSLADAEVEREIAEGS